MTVKAKLGVLTSHFVQDMAVSALAALCREYYMEEPGKASPAVQGEWTAWALMGPAGRAEEGRSWAAQRWVLGWEGEGVQSCEIVHSILPGARQVSSLSPSWVCGVPWSCTVSRIRTRALQS